MSTRARGEAANVAREVLATGNGGHAPRFRSLPSAFLPHAPFRLGPIKMKPLHALTTLALDYGAIAGQIGKVEEKVGMKTSAGRGGEEGMHSKTTQAAAFALNAPTMRSGPRALGWGEGVVG